MSESAAMETPKNEGPATATKIDTGLNRAFPLTLPSLGIVYGDKLPGGNISCRPMTTAEEAILYSASGDGVSKVNAIISACLVTKTIAPEELLLTDRFYILLMLRTRSFGATYEFPFRCQSCGQQSKTSVNLAEDLTINPMDAATVEPFEVTLPISKDTVAIRFLRGKDEARIAKYAKRVRMQSSDPADPSYLYRLALQLVSVNGKEMTLMEAENYVKKMDVGDSAAIRKETEKAEAGVDMTVFIDCPQCGASNEMEMPFTVEFFRPSR